MKKWMQLNARHNARGILVNKACHFRGACQFCQVFSLSRSKTVPVVWFTLSKLVFSLQLMKTLNAPDEDILQSPDQCILCESTAL